MGWLKKYQEGGTIKAQGGKSFEDITRIKTVTSLNNYSSDATLMKQIKKENSNNPLYRYYDDKTIQWMLNNFVKNDSKNLLPTAQKGGRTPIYVTDPKDPLKMAYDDSLKLHNYGLQAEKYFKTNIEPILRHGKQNPSRELELVDDAIRLWNGKNRGGILPKAQSGITTAENFNAQWIDSPKYKEMLEKSAGMNSSVYDAARKIALKNTTVKRSENSTLVPGEKVSGLSVIGSNKFPVITTARVDSKYNSSGILVPGEKDIDTAIHELSHASDYNGTLIPSIDQNKINSYAAKDIYTSPAILDNFKNKNINELQQKQIVNDVWDSTSRDTVNKQMKYVGDPSETRARLNSIRAHSKRNNIYNPFTQFINPEQLNKINIDSLSDLRMIYTDAEIVDLLNSVSKTDNNQQLPIAQSGGSFEAITGIKPIKSLTNVASTTALPINKQKTLAQQQLERIQAEAAYLNQGRVPTAAERAATIIKNRNYAASNPYSKVNEQGDLVPKQYNRSVAGTPDYGSRAKANDKFMDHAANALEAASYVTGAGELYGTYKNIMKGAVKGAKSLSSTGIDELGVYTQQGDKKLYQLGEGFGDIQPLPKTTRSYPSSQELGIQKAIAKGQFSKQELLGARNFMTPREKEIFDLYTKTSSKFNWKPGADNTEYFNELSKLAKDNGISMDELLQSSLTILRKIHGNKAKKLGDFYNLHIIDPKFPESGARKIVGESENLLSSVDRSTKSIVPLGDNQIWSEAQRKRMNIIDNMIDNLPPEQRAKFIKISQIDNKRMYNSVVGEPYTGAEAFKTITPTSSGRIPKNIKSGLTNTSTGNSNGVFNTGQPNSTISNVSGTTSNTGINIPNSLKNIEPSDYNFINMGENPIKGQGYAVDLEDYIGGLSNPEWRKDAGNTTWNWLKENRMRQGDGITNVMSNPTTQTSTLGNIRNKLFGSKSEIDWGKWNSEIPSNKALMSEYSNIERTSKAKGTWMKNPDGSPFQGTPEQFVQQNSENFKKAFPNGFTEGYRGSHQHIQDFKNRDRNDYATFLSDNKEIAQDYANPTKETSFFHPDWDEKDDWKDGIYQLVFPKDAPKVIGNAEGRGWRQLNWDDKIAEGTRSKDIVKNHQEFLQAEGAINKNRLSTDIYANYIKNKNNPESVAEIQNVIDRIGYNKSDIASTVYAIDAEKVPLKSLKYNNGMFDMTNPNIYKSLVPVVAGAGVLQQKKQGGWLNKY